MKTLAIVFGFVVLFLLLAVGVVVSIGIGYYNNANESEQLIVAAYKDYTTVYTSYTDKIADMGQVPAMYKDDLKEVFTSAMVGRYGKDGSQAVFQFLKEHNPNFDSSMYNRLQQVMEAGRNEIKVTGKSLIDARTPYLITLGSTDGFIIKFLGYPKIDMEKLQPFRSQATLDAEATGISQPVKLR